MSNKPMINSIEHGVVMSRPGADRIPDAVPTARHYGMRSQHYGWPGVTKTLDGDILVSASERIRHVDPFGREVVSRSSDGGRNWSEPQVVFDSNTDDRDAAVCTLPDGTVVLTWFSSSAWSANSSLVTSLWSSQRRAVKDDTLAALNRGWLRRSTDGGRTWEFRVYPTIIGQHAGPTALSNGDLIYCGPYEGERLIATRSSDGGKTWSIIGEIPHELVVDKNGVRRPAFNENHCLEVGPGRVLCALRASIEPRNVYIAETRDGGCSWTTPRDLGVYGFPSSLLKLQSGKLLCVFGDRSTPAGAIRGIVSRDGGATWDAENVFSVRDFEHVGADKGYPRAIEVSPNEVLCVYYYVPWAKPDEFVPAVENVDPAEAGILYTRFKVPANE